MIKKEIYISQSVKRNRWNVIINGWMNLASVFLVFSVTCIARLANCGRKHVFDQMWVLPWPMGWMHLHPQLIKKKKHLDVKIYASRKWVDEKYGVNALYPQLKTKELKVKICL